MADYLSGLESMIVAVVQSGLGSAMSGEALARHIPADTFIRTPKNVPLDDEGLEPAKIDRYWYLEYVSSEEDPEPENENDGSVVDVVRFNIRVGYLQGIALSKHTHLRGTETGDFAVQNARRRALYDARRIRRALGWHELYKTTYNANVEVLLLIPDGPRTVDQLPNGLIESVIPFRAELVLNNSINHDP